eukprot:4192839-Pleurochrysis_carterae.AAC.2
MPFRKEQSVYHPFPCWQFNTAMHNSPRCTALQLQRPRTGHTRRSRSCAAARKPAYRGHVPDTCAEVRIAKKESATDAASSGMRALVGRSNSPS